MRKKDVEETKSATIFLDKNPSTLAKSRLAKVLPEGKGGLDWRWSTWNHGMMWWHDGDMKHGKTSMLYHFFRRVPIKTTSMLYPKLRDFHERLVEFRGGFCFHPVAGSSPQQSPTKTATRNSSTGGNGVFDTVYMYIIKIYVDGQGVLKYTYTTLKYDSTPLLKYDAWKPT